MTDRVYDHVVVGAGAVGCIVASRLSEDENATVALIEAGPDFREDQLPPDVANALEISIGHHDWPCPAEAYPGRMMGYGCGKLMGGSSSTNGCMALRGYPENFTRWADMGNTEWAWDKVLPYFKKLEHDLDFKNEEHGQEGPVPIVRWNADDLPPIGKAFRDKAIELGYPWNDDLNSPQHDTGIGIVPLNRRGTLRMSAAMAYIEPARGRSNLTIRANCLASRVLFDGVRAVGVEVIENGARNAVSGHNIVMSAGALHTPPILLRSGIGPKQDLDGWGIPVVHHNPNVGRNLFEHSQVCLGLVPRGPGFNTDYPDIQLIINYTDPLGAYQDDMQLYLVNRLQLGRFPNYTPPAGVSLLVGLMCVLNQPESRGFITLNSTDPTIEPRIVLNLATHPWDLARLVEGLRRCWTFAQSDALKPWCDGMALVTEEMMADEASLVRYLRETVATIWHPVGTCKMGPEDDPTAVVDQFGHVYGVENLRVADASIFPYPVSRNPNLTCYMAGELIAERIRADSR